MDNLLKSEFYKLFKDRSFWVVVFLLTIAAIYWPISHLFDSGAHPITGIDFYLNSFGGNNYIMKLAPCILAGFFISSEYSTGTMKSLAATGNSRGRIYFTKLMVFTVGALIISLIWPVINEVLGSLLFGWGNLPHISDPLYLLRTLGLSLLYAGAFASIMAFFAIMLTDSGKTIGLLLIFFFLFESLFYFISEKFTLIKPLYNYSVYKLLLDITKVEIGSAELLKLISIPILTFIVFGLLGMLIFKKKEIK